MPDSPVPSSMVSEAIPKVSSPAQLHISTSNAQLMLEGGRPPISAPNSALPNGFHASSPNQPLSPGILNGMQLPPTCGVRQLSKLKRFLTTLQQFGSDISPDIGERVRGLIVNLVNNAITVEEFHQQLQEATNFPLRPFVIPFLKTNLPLLQQELLQCSQLSKRSPQPPHQFIGSESHERERVKNESEDFAFDHIGSKRKSEYDRPKENGHHMDHPGISPSKQRKSPGLDSDATAIVEHLMESIKQDSDEWRNLETILQCVVSFVDKAKRSMAIIQERCLRDREEMTSWARSMAAETESEIKRRTAEQVAKTLKDSEDRVNDVKRRAEEAVGDVKRQAVVELQKAVSAAEEKANDALSQVHQKMEQAVQEARRQATEETSNLINQQENSKENCWNCGRKANETCSGCNVARYCGKFCQHKDWEQHQKNCGKQTKHENNPHSPHETTSRSPTRSNTPRVISSGKISPIITSDNSSVATSVPVSVMQVSSASS